MGAKSPRDLTGQFVSDSGFWWYRFWRDLRKGDVVSERRVKGPTIMHDRCPFGGVNRRQFLGASVAAVPLISAVPSLAAAQAGQVTGNVTHQGGDGKTLSKLAAPGLYPGQVVEVRNPRDVPERHPGRRPRSRPRSIAA